MFVGKKRRVPRSSVSTGTSHLTFLSLGSRGEKSRRRATGENGLRPGSGEL